MITLIRFNSEYKIVPRSLQPCTPVLQLLAASSELCTQLARPWDQGVMGQLCLKFSSSAHGFVLLSLAVTIISLVDLLSKGLFSVILP